MPAPPALLDPTDARPDARRRLALWLTLQHHIAWRPQAARRELEVHGDPERVLDALSCRTVDRSRLEADRLALARCRARGVVWGSPFYPERLARLSDAPPLLWVRGDPAWLGRPAVAVVGARAATETGRARARHLACDLAATGLVVVSGLARGIDAEAHRGALAAGGASVAFLGCGPDRVYPSGHARLAHDLCARGAVVSELPPGTPPLRHHFPLRNRLISALCRAVLVVEARERSGSLVTARHALDQGCDVMVVPGSVEAPQHAGSNRLLRDGARVALDANDVLRVYDLEIRRVASRRPPSEPADPSARRALRALREQPCTPDELARRLGLGPRELAAALLVLELERRVVTERDGRLRAVAPARLSSPVP